MSELQLIPLGGMGRVTQNMYLYVYQDEILIVDCGIGFPDVYMPGVDVILPDISHLFKLLDEGKIIVGMVISHGHEDHLGAIPYFLPDLPDFPIWGSSLTLGFITERLADKKITKDLSELKDHQPVEIGEHFKVTSVSVTHSVPDTKHLFISTPEGMVYHGSDFKIDPTPVDGIKTDFEFIKQVSSQGIVLALLDCLRIERQEATPSESTVGPAIDELMSQTQGKFVITLMSSHIHRIQQVVDSAVKNKRKVIFVGRSVEQNVRVATELGKLSIPNGVELNKKRITQYPSRSLCVVIAGSQGQEGSSLVRAVYGEHSMIQINPQDKVVFSADAIPGNEVPYFKAIDELARNGVEVVYPDINHKVHQSGHASAPEQLEMLSYIKPNLVMPIGGADRHRILFKKNVIRNGMFSAKQVLVPQSGEILGISGGSVRVVNQIVLKPTTVDGLGIGDVGPVVLSDRLSLSQAGIVVLVLPKKGGKIDINNIKVVSRGFVFMKEADEVVTFIQDHAAEVISKAGNIKEDELRRRLERQLSKKLYKVIKREPMIVSVIV